MSMEETIEIMNGIHEELCRLGDIFEEGTYAPVTCHMVQAYEDPNPIESACDGVNCLNCAFAVSGQCRRSSPVSVGEDGYARWPLIHPADCCGDFVAKPRRLKQ